jgi:hypothetical protein
VLFLISCIMTYSLFVQTHDNISDPVTLQDVMSSSLPRVDWQVNSDNPIGGVIQN